MQVKVVLASVALALSCSSAMAARYSLGQLANGENLLSSLVAPDDGAISVAKGSFEDVFTFSLAGLSSVAISVAPYADSVNPINNKILLGIDSNFPSNGYGYRLYSGTFGESQLTALARSNSAGEGFTSSLSAGNYSLLFAGKAIGSKGGIYDGAVTVSAVPEPETYALLLAGLGLMGAVVKRRKGQQA